MKYFIAILTGILTAVMISFNGNLAIVTGTLCATVIIHFVGLLAITLIAIVKKEQISYRKDISIVLYMGGVIGVFTTIFSNIAYDQISISAILALCLLGQTITSLTIDVFGLFSMPKQSFTMKKLMGIIVVFAGSMIMILPLETSRVISVVASLLSGTTIVLSRTVNGRLAEKRSAIQSTFYNFVTGLAGSLIIVLILGRNEPVFVGMTNPLTLSMFCGGVVGVIAIVLLNMVVNSISAFQMTLLSFGGQLATGIILDYFQKGSFIPRNLAGCLMLIIGLCIYSFNGYKCDNLLSTWQRSE